MRAYNSRLAEVPGLSCRWGAEHQVAPVRTVTLASSFRCLSVNGIDCASTAGIAVGLLVAHRVISLRRKICLLLEQQRTTVDFGLRLFVRF